MGIDGRDYLVEQLISGNYLGYDGMPANCSGDCLQPAASTLVNYLADQAASHTISTGQAPAVLDAGDSDGEEPPLSDS